MFISEPISPEPGSFGTDLMAQGLAGLPAAFAWRGRRYAIIACLDHRKQSSPEGGAGERYLRRQVFEVELDTGQRATIYLERHARRGSSRSASRRRWFIYSIDDGPGGPPSHPVNPSQGRGTPGDRQPYPSEPPGGVAG